MLFIEGEVGSKVYQNERITFDDLLKLAKAEDYFSFVRKSDPNARVEFEYHKSKKKMKGGVLIFPSGYNPISTMKVNIDGRIVRITYAESEKIDPITKVRETMPRKISFGDKATKPLMWNRDRELILWMALHPWNASSPLRAKNDNSPVVWDIVDRDKRAVEWEELASEDIKIRTLFMTEDIEVLKRKAKGMGLVFSVDVSKAVVRQTLMQAYENAIKQNNRANFISQFDKAETTVAGTIQELIDKGLIERGRTDSSGRVVWQWRAGLSETGKIMTVDRGLDAAEALKRYIVSNFDMFDKTLTKVLKQDQVAANPAMQAFANEVNAHVSPSEKEVNELTNEELVKELKANDIIGFNKETTSVHFYSEKDFGVFTKEPLYKIETPKNWVVELATALEDKKLIELKVSLVEKLEKFRNN